jgi:molybdopterin molybdotransferase
MMPVTALPFYQARQTIMNRILAASPVPRVESVSLSDCSGRILAQAVAGDRHYPPVDKSLRDGYAVRSAEVPGALEVVGEIRAGSAVEMEVGPRQAAEIMTGAPIPRGADAVVMVEHTRREGSIVYIEGAAKPGQHIVEKGHEAKRGEIVLHPGHRLGYAEVGLLATFGYTQVQVFRRPVVAILSTGDEVVDVDQRPSETEVRNANAWTLAVQVRKAGGEPKVYPIVRDDVGELRSRIEDALKTDLILFSGGVSAGKYDLVETVLGEMGAEFYITRVAIRPGQPYVFGRLKDRFFCGHPGNPASTMITFEIFTRAAVELLSGVPFTALPLLKGRLTRPLEEKAGLTRFLPAKLESDGVSVTPMPWKGSSDVPTMARCDCFLVVEAERGSYESGEWISVLMKSRSL